MNYSQVLRGLEGLAARGMDFGTQRTRDVLDKLDSPDKKLKIVHIAGTNGKGSVAEYIAEILLCAGKTVGVFTSPAVYGYLEQYRINGKIITDELFAKSFGAALNAAQGATRFEVETAGALYAFALAGCEYAVIECGLGGLYDSTNAIAKKEIAVITSLSLEHTAILGDTIQDICRHKAGIIKGCPAVVSGLQTDEVKAYMRGKGVVFADKPLKTIKSDLGGQIFLYDGLKFETRMTGGAQPYNAAAAIEAARLLKIAEDAIYSGVKRAFLPARLEVLRANGNLYILDGAHNPASFAPLADLLASLKGADVVFGSLSDKDVKANIEIIKPYVNKVYTVTPESPRAMPAAAVAEICAERGVKARVCASVAEALENACGTVAVCGTFTILKQAKDCILKK